ncbi:MAG: cephalosporin hydroxylase family protein [Zavarzinella sp.]
MSFEEEMQARLAEYPHKPELQAAAKQFMQETIREKYSYHFHWLGRPIIQYPQDIVKMQELIWAVQPDLIIETGVAHGGSLIFHASMLAILDQCDARQTGKGANKSLPRKVLGIDIDIRPHNRSAIEAHPLSSYIELLQGSSIDPTITSQVSATAQKYEKVLICLDSNHTHDHVYEELLAYAPLTSVSSYCVVFDGVVEDLPSELIVDRPWGKGNNPKTAVHAYLKHLENHPTVGQDGKPLSFEIDHTTDSQLLISVAPEGYLKRLG